MKGKCYFEETSSCEKCGEMYYPPQYSKAGFGKGYHIPFCARCKEERRKEKLNARRLRYRLERKERKPLKKWQTILKALQERPRTYEELLSFTLSPKPHISYLRNIGYEIRNVGHYIIVREPKERLVEEIQ